MQSNSTGKGSCSTRDAKLHIVCFTDNDAAVQSSLRSVLSGSVSDGEVRLYDTFNADCSATNDAPILFAAYSPVESLARRLGLDADPEAALTEWRSEVTDLLTACRKINTGASLISLSHLLSGDPQTVTELERRFSLSLGSASYINFFDDVGAERIFLAGALLNIHREDAQHAHEVETQFIGPYVGSTPGMSAIVSAWERMNATEFALQNKEDECGVLKDIIDAMILASEENTKRFLQGASLENTGLAVSSDEKQMLLNKQYKQEIQDLKETLNAVYASSSWKVMGPIRSIVGWMRNGKNKAS